MEDRENQALLPAGLHDVLAPDAAHEAALVGTLTQAFGTHGYERVSPPMLEYETALIGAGGPGMDDHVFRVIDPTSGRMMAIRADMTPQVARIAATRLSRQPRPLRLSYGGQVLTVRGSQLRPERQFAQAGAELIGPDNIAADIEILILAVDALSEIGIEGITIDLNSPALVGSVISALDAENGKISQLRAALDHKDQVGVAALAGESAGILSYLIAATGPVDEALAKLGRIALPDAAKAEIERLRAVAEGVRAHRPDLALTLDPVEYRGFEYQTGVSFTIFLAGVRGELGRGGRYVTAAGEHATGLTIFLDTIRRAITPSPAQAKTVYLPQGSDPLIGATLRKEGWTTIAELAPDEDPATEAKRLGCTHIFETSEKQPIEIG